MFEFKGGIQTYSQFFLQALQALCPEWNYRVLLKHDRQAPAHHPFMPTTTFQFAGRAPLPLRTPVYALQLLVAAIQQRPHLIITTHLNFTPVAYWLKQWLGIPYWTVAHGVEAWNIQRPVLRTALQNADRILAVSSYTRNRLLKEQPLDPNHVVLLPNTFDPSRFHIAPKPKSLLHRYNLSPYHCIILTVARLDSQERYKGYDQILRAMPAIRQQLPQAHYVLVGKGNDRPRVESLIQQLGLQDCVTLTGFVPDDELTDHYNLCDVFAMPSKGEGFGIVYLEALACGKPTLGGNQDGAIDALCRGELGVLVNPDDVDAIAHALTRLLQGTYPHPLLYQAEALRQRVINIYGFEQFQAMLAKILQTC
ncbi:MAG: glycosyltransferase [Cyanobacteria bacterium]|nr:glycosyltransferase [Cyanobacteriota bacterium]MDW8200372.1 glycosyltransferase [Cyanobacteriota bacterium SKYGB_h_bin112]